MNKRQKWGLLLVAAGILLVCGALCIHLSQQHEEEAAGDTAAALLQVLEQDTMPLPPAPLPETEAPATSPGEVPTWEDPLLPEMEFMGYSLIGSIRVPSVGICLPVLGDWSEEMLKAAPCRYEGGLFQGGMILMGHNYKRHFAPLREVVPGALVEFENTAGQVFSYKVDRIEYLKGHEGELLPDGSPLTLFTCTPGGRERLVVRCVEAE